MRWVTYADASGHDRAGVVEDGAINPLERGVTLLELLDSGGLSAAGGIERATFRQFPSSRSRRE